MNSVLFRILIPRRFSNGAMISWGTVGILGIGIGIFLSLQILFANFYDGLMSQILQVVDEVSIRHNPLRERSEAEEDDEFFRGKKSSSVERTELDSCAIEEANGLVARSDKLGAQPVVRIRDSWIGVKKQDGVLHKVEAVLVFADWCEYGLGVFDSMRKDVRAGFTVGEDGVVPVLAPKDLLQTVSLSEVFEMRYAEKDIRCRLVGNLPPNKLAEKMLVMPFGVAAAFRGNNRATEIAVRGRNGKIAKAEFDRLKKSFESEFGDEFIVSYWEDIVKAQKRLFDTMNFIFSMIVSSLFVIAFFFAYTSFNILIERKRKQLAIALAIGCKPAAIRRALLGVALLLGIVGLGVGMFFSVVLLDLLKHSWVQTIFESAGMRIGEFRLDFGVAVLLVVITSTVMLGSAWRASRRVFVMNPVEDIRA